MKTGNRVWLDCLVDGAPDERLPSERQVVRLRLIDGQRLETNVRNVVKHLPEGAKSLDEPEIAKAVDAPPSTKDVKQPTETKAKKPKKPEDAGGY